MVVNVMRWEIIRSSNICSSTRIKRLQSGSVQSRTSWSPDYHPAGVAAHVRRQLMGLQTLVDEGGRIVNIAPESVNGDVLPIYDLPGEPLDRPASACGEPSGSRRKTSSSSASTRSTNPI